MGILALVKPVVLSIVMYLQYHYKQFLGHNLELGVQFPQSPQKSLTISLTQVAHMVEQKPYKFCVAGSTPVLSL